MSVRNSGEAPVVVPELVVTRVFDAPRELVFDAWTRPEHLQRWWAPKGCTTPYCKVDLRPGGIFHFCMRLPEGREIWGRGVFKEVVRPERIVYVDSFADEQGNPVPPSRYGMSTEHPSETLVTITFKEQGAGTRLTLRHAFPDHVPERDATRQGWTEMLDRLAELLARKDA
jgi:uncharacterized protein YndB with AHSA1/START domain